MSFGESISTCFKKYADFSGRASRSEFWWFYLFVAIVNLALTFTWAASLTDPYNDTFPPGLIFSLIFGLAVLLPILAAMVRRLHDTGRSGAFVFISLIPFVGGIILIVFLATEGTPGPNQYGPPAGRYGAGYGGGPGQYGGGPGQYGGGPGQYGTGPDQWGAGPGQQGTPPAAPPPPPPTE